MARAVYVHVPFCEQICHYCDFNKFFLANQPTDDYLSLCEKEISNTLDQFPPEKIKTIYVGGGTPTALSTMQLKKLLTDLKNYFPIATDYEWTVEVNPGSADEEKMAMLKEVGVNRLSIGVQTFDRELLKKIGRDHQPEDVEKTIVMAREAGITNLSVDLMFGLPGQTLELWQSTLNEIVQLPIAHVSAYSLKIEERTVFYHQWQKGKLSLPGEDKEGDMYEMLQRELDKGGFQQYEISNFAKPEKESRHNLTYWNNESYYGIGAGAHSYLSGTRRINHGPLPKYMESMRNTGFPYREVHPVPRKEQMEEEMFMGLRKLSGVSYNSFRKKYNVDMEQVFPEVIQTLSSKGLLVKEDNSIRLTKKGLLLANEAFEQFLLGD
ncbi:MAG: radical SAM family heme chaperone HemW [Bacillus sp. (in: Bacteria)]|nr:radical SAM family heme chaperone HemW [Bacillus sp. (in: firmicutes)]